jgi:hypothetical protein
MEIGDEMKVVYQKYSIQIIPECPADEVYLETVCKTKKAGECCEAKRIPPMGLEHSWAYLEIRSF